MDNITERVVNTTVKVLDCERGMVTPAANFSQDLGADSLDSAELVMSLEDEFGIEIHYEDVESIQTVQETINYVKEKLDA